MCWASERLSCWPGTPGPEDTETALPRRRSALICASCAPQSGLPGGPHILVVSAAPRPSTVARTYADPSSPLFAKYGVTLLYIGKYETEGAGSCPTAGPYENVTASTYPGSGWTLIFQNDGARIYRRAS